MRLLYRKISRWSLVLIFLPAVLHAAENTATIALRRELGKCALAWQRQDVEGIVSYLPEAVVTKSGGRAAVVRELKEQFAEVRAYGAQRMEVQPGKIAGPQLLGEWLTSLIPVVAVVHGPHLDLTQRTHVLAVSRDRGKHWFFVVLYQITQAELIRWFPEFADKIKVPTTPDPQVELVY